MGVREGDRKEGSAPLSKNRSAFVLYIVVLSRISLGKSILPLLSTKIFENLWSCLFTDEEIEPQRDAPLFNVACKYRDFPEA